MILADPSELREGSRLPPILSEQALPWPGLEEQTGADLVVSPLSLPPVVSDNLLAKHCQAGVMVQRKTGMDLPSSITDGRLSRSLEKMLRWGPMPWLAFVGKLERYGTNCKIDGREGMSYNSVVGAFDWWQVRGGYLAMLANDASFVEWVDRWPSKFKVLEEHPHKVLTGSRALQVLSADDKPGMLLALPGIGPEKAGSLLAQYGGVLAQALVGLSNKHGCPVPGIGQGTVDAVRAWLGLSHTEQLAVIDEDILVRLLGYFMTLMEISDKRQGIAWYSQIASWVGLPITGSKFATWQEWANHEIDNMQE